MNQLRASFNDSWMEATDAFPIPEPVAKPAGESRCIVVNGSSRVDHSNKIRTMFRCSCGPHSRASG